jgi:hypothetical protein
MWVDLSIRKLGVPLAYFPRLLNATFAPREHYKISGGDTAGCTGMKLTKTSAVENLLLDIGDRTGNHLMAA